MQGDLYITGDPDADALLNTDPLALLLGMLLDQQVPMEWAFMGPLTLQKRLGHLDVARIAAMDPADVVAAACEKPAIHRFPKAMAERIHALCVHLVDHYDGDAELVWRGLGDAKELYNRLRAVPGYGDEKSKIFVAILAKRFGVRPDGWENVAAPFSDPEPRSVADISGEEAFSQVRAWKQAKRAAGKTKQD